MGVGVRQLEWISAPPAPVELAPIRPRGLPMPAAARYLGVSLRTVERLRQSGELRAYHVGRRVLIELDSLDAYATRDPDDAELERLLERRWIDGG